MLQLYGVYRDGRAELASGLSGMYSAVSRAFHSVVDFFVIAFLLVHLVGPLRVVKIITGEKRSLTLFTLSK